MEKKVETTVMGYMGDCQNYGPFCYNPGPNLGDPKRDHMTIIHKRTETEDQDTRGRGTRAPGATADQATAGGISLGPSKPQTAKSNSKTLNPIEPLYNIIVSIVFSILPT